MEAEYKLLGAASVGQQPVLVLKLRTTHEILISEQTLPQIRTMIERLSTEPEARKKDSNRFARELTNMVQLYVEMRDGPLVRYRDLIQTEWAPFPGYLSYESLTAMAAAFESDWCARIEGDCVSGMYLVLNTGLDVFRRKVDEASLQAVKAECEAIIAEGNNIPLAKVSKGRASKRRAQMFGAAEWAVIVLGAIALGIDAWRLYREEQALDRAQKEREREEQEKLRHDIEDRARECSPHSSGGPADHDAMDRIGRTC